MRVFKLKFHSALHVDAKGSGEPETAEEFVRSDTLSAALCISWSALYPGEAVPEFYLRPPFKVSSAFPFVGEVLFFPKPVWPIWKAADDLERKAMKKTKWLAGSVFSRVLAGERIRPGELELPQAGVAVSTDDIVSYPELRGSPWWVASQRQRVAIDRLGNADARPFFFALQFFGPQSGLWFAAEAEPETMNKLKRVLDYLGDTGIGADRNSGLGHFVVADDFDFDFSVGAKSVREARDGWFTLSLFNPSAEDDLQNLVSGAAYDLTTRSGWIHRSSAGRPPVRAFAEGSYFPDKPAGRVVEMLTQETIDEFKLAISHRAPRDFRAVSLPCAEPPYLKGDRR